MLMRKKRLGDPSPKSGRPVQVRTPTALRWEIQSLTRLRAALLLDPIIERAQQKKLDKKIENLITELAELLRTREAHAA
jgi:hypothetical protein